MGYDVSLKMSNEIVQVTGHQTGSNLMAEVNDQGDLDSVNNSLAECCITYNYGRLFGLVDISLRDFQDKTAKETIPILEQSVEKLGTDKDDDYWKPTTGNAGSILETLLGWATLHPDATWEVT